MTTDSTRALVAQLKAALEILAIGAHRRKLQEEAAYGPCFSATRVERARDEYKAVKDAIAAADQWLESPPTNQCGETCERAKLCATCARGLEPLTDGQAAQESEKQPTKAGPTILQIPRLTA